MNDIITKDIYEDDTTIPIPPPVPETTTQRIVSRGGRRFVTPEEKATLTSGMVSILPEQTIDETGMNKKIETIVQDVKKKIDPRPQIRNQFSHEVEPDNIQNLAAETNEEAKIRTHLEELQNNILESSENIVGKMKTESAIAKRECSFAEDNQDKQIPQEKKDNDQNENNLGLMNIKNFTSGDINDPQVDLEPLSAEQILKSEEELHQQRIEAERLSSQEYINIITNDTLTKQITPAKPDLNKIITEGGADNVGVSESSVAAMEKRSQDLQYVDSLHVEIMRREGSLQYSTYVASCNSMGVQPNPRVMNILENNGCICGSVIDFNTDIVGEVGFVALCKALVVSEFVFNQITVLNFQRNGLGNMSIQSLATSFSGAPSLREINISYNRFGHRAVAFLKNLIITTPSLMKLDVRGCDLLTFYDRQYLYRIFKSTGKDKIFLPEME